MLLPGVAVAAEPTWTAAEVRPLPGGPAIAVSAAWDGGWALFSGGPGGFVVRALDGAELARTEVLHPRALVVRELDGEGEPEVIACGPEGIALVRGTRAGLALPRPLSDEPCEGLAAFDLAQWPGLASVSGGELVTWVPGAAGLAPTRTGVRVPDPRDLVGLGPRVAVLDAAGDVHLTAPDEVRAGPFTALAADGAALVTATAAGVVAHGGRTWRLEADGLRDDGGAHTPLPFAPERAVAADPDGDGCPDLWVVGAAGDGAWIVGRCGARPVAPPPAADPEPPVATLRPAGPPPEVAAVTLSESGWQVVDVRAGEPLAVRVGWDDGRPWRWSSRGGPPGFSVLGDGTLDYVGDGEDVGRWRASVKSRLGMQRRWSGVEVRVWPTDAALPAPSALPPTPAVPAPADPAVRASVAVGVAGGFAVANGSRWESLGSARSGGGASPFGAILVETRLARGVDLLTGFDAAPLFAFPSAPDRRAHVLATTAGAQVGSRTLQVGAYGTFGYTVRGAGLRVALPRWVDGRGRPTGPELRATWLAPQIGGEVALAWAWRL